MFSWSKRGVGEPAVERDASLAVPVPVLVPVPASAATLWTAFAPSCLACRS